MTTENISLKIEKLGKQLNEYQGVIISTLEENNKNLRTILEHQVNKKHKELYSDLETAKNIIDNIIKQIQNKGKAIESSHVEENKILSEENLREIIINFQEIIIKLENTRYLTIEDMKKCLENHNNPIKLTIVKPYLI